jgi:hypothetical protein
MIWEKRNPKVRLRYNRYPSEPDLKHSKIPTILDPLRQIDESQRYHPILQWWWVGIERKYLQVNRIELVYGNRCLRVRVQIFEKLLQDGMNSWRGLRRCQKA